jgi:hypothetical protein
MSTAREFSEFLDAALGIVVPGERLQILAKKLVKAFSQCLGAFPSSSDNLLVDR